MNTVDNSMLIKKRQAIIRKHPIVESSLSQKFHIVIFLRLGHSKRFHYLILHYITFFNHDIYSVYTWLLLCIVNVYFCPLERSFEKHNPPCGPLMIMQPAVLLAKQSDSSHNHPKGLSQKQLAAAKFAFAFVFVF